jgi:hypothetical protein
MEAFSAADTPFESAILMLPITAVALLSAVETPATTAVALESATEML